MDMNNISWLDEIDWDDDGLVPAVAQDANSGRVLTLAWMNRESLQKSVLEGTACYWSRSRRKLWVKGESSGHTQVIREIRTDCDRDVILLLVEQSGGIACHTGRYSCFYSRLGEDGWEDLDPVLKAPEDIYKSNG